jgi:hypothetical protein
METSQNDVREQLKTPKDFALYYKEKFGCLFPLRNPDVEEDKEDDNEEIKKQKATIRKNRKRPAVDWELYQTMRPSIIQIDRWFTKNPNYNLALPTGWMTGIIAIDVDGDTAKQRIREKLEIASINLSSAFRNTMMNITGSGGRHFIFRIAEEEGEDSAEDIIENITSTVIWANDEAHSQIRIQGNGSYIVAPPSRHPNGNYYTWNEKTPEPLTRQELLEFIRLVSANPHNVKIPLKQQQQQQQSNEISSSPVGIVPSADINNTNTNAPAEIIQELYEAIRPYYIPGERNDIIFSLSGWMRKDGHFSLADCEALVTLLCQNSGFSDEDLEASLDKVRTTYQKPIEELKGRSGMHEILVSTMDMSKVSTPEFRERTDTYNKLFEIISKYANRNKPEKLLDGCVIMEHVGLESQMYMTVFCKDDFEDKATGGIRPVRVIRALQIAYDDEKIKKEVYRWGDIILNAAPIAPIKKIYDPLFELQKYEIIFEYVGAMNAIKTKVVGPYTKKELIEYLKHETNFVFREKQLENAFNQVITGFERKNMVVERTETETEGLIWSHEENRLYLSKRASYKPTPEECRAAIDVIEQVQAKFYVNRIPERPIERKRFAHFLKIGLTSVVDFARRQNGAAAPNKGKFIPRQDLAGTANVGKSYGYAGLALRLFRLPVDGSSPYIISAGSVETEARFIEQTKWTTFPVILDDIDWLSSWDKDRRAITVMPLLKNQTERTNPRDIQSVENKKRHLPSCAYIMLTHNSALIDEDGFIRRSTGHEFTAGDAKTKEEVNDYNEFFNQHGHSFGYLGDFAIWYYLNNPDVLFNDWQTIAELILIEFYRYASSNNEDKKLTPPDWLLNEVVESATSQEALAESRTISIISTLHDIALSQTWSRNRRDIALWIIKNLRKNAIGTNMDDGMISAGDMIDDTAVTATIEEKLRAIAELNLVPYIKWHPQKEMVCIGADFVHELRKRTGIDRVSLKQIESYCQQLKYDTHVRFGGSYSKPNKMLTVKVGDLAEMLSYINTNNTTTNSGEPKQTTIMMM